MTDITIKCGFDPIENIIISKATIDNGENLRKSGHVINAMEQFRGLSGSLISASVIRQTSVNALPYSVRIETDSKRKIIAATCPCPAGAMKQCKHLSAVISYINNEKTTSKTDKPCDWIAPSKAGGKYSKGKKFSELFPPTKKIKLDVDSSDVMSILSTKNGINSDCALLQLIKAEMKSEGEQFASQYLNEILVIVYKEAITHAVRNIINFALKNQWTSKELETVPAELSNTRTEMFLTSNIKVTNSDIQQVR